MTPAEVSNVLAMVRMLWPHSNLGDDPKAVAAVWHSMLVKTEAADVEATVRELAQTGREHAPPVGVIVSRLAERQTDAPDWDEAWEEIDRLKWRFHPAFPDRSVPPADRFSHPLIAAFAIPAWRELCLGPAPGTGDFGTFYAQQREAYRAMRARSERSVGLGVVGAPRLRGDLRPVDPSRHLPKAK